MIDAIDSAGLCEAVRTGDTSALLAWADTFEEDGERRIAEAIRMLPSLVEAIERTVQLWLKADAKRQFIVVCLNQIGQGVDSDSNIAAWRLDREDRSREGERFWRGINYGITDTSSPPGLAASDKTPLERWLYAKNANHGNLSAVLLSRWNALHPAIEWIAVQLKSKLVQLTAREPSGMGEPALDHYRYLNFNLRFAPLSPLRIVRVEGVQLQLEEIVSRQG